MISFPPWNVFFVGCFTLLFQHGLARDFRGSDESRTPVEAMKTWNVLEKDPRSGSLPTQLQKCVTEEGEPGYCVLPTTCPELPNLNRNGEDIHAEEEGMSSKRKSCRNYSKKENLVCCDSRRRDTNNSSSLETETRRKRSRRSIFPSTKECGFSTVDRIVNGKMFPHGAHPWLVGIGNPSRTGPFIVVCGGTLITRKHVVTATHCFNKRPGLDFPSHVRLGEYSLSKNSEKQSPINVRIVKRKNPDYNRVSKAGDIELLLLEREVTFTDYIRPACLPFGFQSKESFDNIPMTIVGWGLTSHEHQTRTDLPLEANVTVLSMSECRNRFKNHKLLALDHTQICAFTRGTDTCSGDSGGPLLYFHTQDLRYYLLGVVSFGVRCAFYTFPGVYVYVPQYLTWISDNLQ